MRFGHMLASVALGFATLASTGAKAVEIEYWQYVFDTRVKAMNQLIAKFQEAKLDPVPVTRLASFAPRRHSGCRGGFNHYPPRLGVEGFGGQHDPLPHPAGG